MFNKNVKVNNIECMFIRLFGNQQASDPNNMEPRESEHSHYIFILNQKVEVMPNTSSYQASNILFIGKQISKVNDYFIISRRLINYCIN